jgi:hypothetical protein
VVMLQTFDRNFEPRLAASDLPQEARRAIDQERHKLTAAALPSWLTPAQRAAVEHDLAAAYVAGFRAVMLVSAGLAVGGAVAAWLMIGGRTPRPQ